MILGRETTSKATTKKTVQELEKWMWEYRS